MLTWVSLLVTSAVSPQGACQESARLSAADRRAQPRVAIKISAATTRVTEPLRADGYPDFVAALNLQCAQRATRENNAAIPFWLAVGPRSIVEELRPDYFRLLGIPPLPLDGDYFIDFERYRADHVNGATETEGATRPGAPHSAWKKLQARTRQPWSAQDYPTYAAWLAANRPPLQLLLDASQRRVRYDPLLAVRNGSLSFALLPAAARYGDVVQALAARAMLRLDQRDVEAAWDDLRACHRLAILAAQGPTLSEASLAGRSLEIACAGDQALLGYGTLTVTQIDRMRADLRALPPWPRLSEKFDVAERFTYLNVVCDFAREGRSGLRWLKSGRSSAEDESLSRVIDSIARDTSETPIDWDLILHLGNAWFDRIVDAYNRGPRAEQQESLRTLVAEFREMQMRAADLESLEQAMRADPRRAVSERLGHVFLVEFGPDISIYLDNDDRNRMRCALSQLVFALAAYRAEHGSLVDDVAQLIPHYCAEIPPDLFTGNPLLVRRDDRGIVVYSVGINRRDDGAKSYDDRKSVTDDWDDIVIRLPASP